MKIKTIIELDKVLGNEIDKRREEELDSYFYTLIKPEVFWGHDGFTVQHNKAFETSCAIISQQVSVDPKRMNTLEWFQVLEELRRQNKQYNGTK